MEKMKILVIGASGLLAGPVIRKLDEKGYDLRLFSRSVKPSMFVNDYDIMQGDVFNRADIEKAVNGCDGVHISLASDDDVLAVSKTPLLPLKIIAFLTRNRQLKFAASLFGYFEKVHEPEVPEADLALPGRPATDFDSWVRSKQ